MSVWCERHSASNKPSLWNMSPAPFRSARFVFSAHSFSVSKISHQTKHAAVISEKAPKNHCVIPAKRQNSSRPVNVAEHVAAKEPGVSLRRWWRPKQSQRRRKYWSFIYHLKNPNVCPFSACLLDVEKAYWLKCVSLMRCYAVVEEEFRSFILVKVAVVQCENAPKSQSPALKI